MCLGGKVFKNDEFQGKAYKFSEKPRRPNRKCEANFEFFTVNFKKQFQVMSKFDFFYSFFIVNTINLYVNPHEQLKEFLKYYLTFFWIFDNFFFEMLLALISLRRSSCGKFHAEIFA